MILNPCRKCIVRACCTILCEPYTKWKTRADRMITVITTPFRFLIDLYKDKDWVLFGIMVFCYVSVVLQAVNIIVVIVREGA
jgi:hypothetical protein